MHHDDGEEGSEASTETETSGSETETETEEELYDAVELNEYAQEGLRRYAAALAARHARGASAWPRKSKTTHVEPSDDHDHDREHSAEVSVSDDEKEEEEEEFVDAKAKEDDDDDDAMDVENLNPGLDRELRQKIASAVDSTLQPEDPDATPKPKLNRKASSGYLSAKL